MPRTKRDSGQDVLKSVLELIPEAQRSTVESVFQDASIQASIADYLGDATLRQQDYSRARDEAREEKARAEAWHKNLTEWHAAQQEKLAELERLKASGGNPGGNLGDGGDGSTTPKVDLPKNLVTTDDLTKLLSQRDLEWGGFFAVAQPLSIQHYQKFGEALDIQAVMAEATKTGRSFQDAYRQVYSEQLQTFDTKQSQQKEADLRKQIEEKVRAEYSARPPYPTANTPDASVVDALGFDAKPSGTPEDYSVDATVAAYRALVAQRMSGAPSGA